MVSEKPLPFHQAFMGAGTLASALSRHSSYLNVCSPQTLSFNTDSKTKAAKLGITRVSRPMPS